MNKKSKKTLLSATILIFIYILSYLLLSRIPMKIYDHNAYEGNGARIWGFYSLELRLDEYGKPYREVYKHEIPLRIIFWPLIKVDRYMFGNYHILEKDLPYIGG